MISPFAIAAPSELGYFARAQSVCLTLLHQLFTRSVHLIDACGTAGELAGHKKATKILSVFKWSLVNGRFYESGRGLR